jgi:aminopeptidase N
MQNERIKMNAQPMLLSDYKPLKYKITHCDIEFELHDAKTIVLAKSKVKKVENTDEPFILNGENLELKSLKIDGVDYEAYSFFENTLVINVDHLQDFTLEIETQINPKANTALEGLYKSGGAFCTQCEAEGFRRITYFIDRPDNLCIFSTKITADKNYKYLLSNGNKVYEKILDDKRIVKWSDPFAKPSYLFALVAGNFDVLQDNFITKSKKNVSLQIFTDIFVNLDA